MANAEIYDSLIQQKGLAYRKDKILGPERSHYGDPIDQSPGRLAGNSHIWGDASAEVQSQTIDALMQAAGRGGLDQRQTAYVLAIARAESGFNPDAAAGTTTAFGIGQFVDGTGRAYGITPSNRGDITKQAEALVETFKDNAALANSRGQGEAYIYKYHHDGPVGDYGGLELSKLYVVPYIDKYEIFVRQYEKTHTIFAVDPDFDRRNHLDVRDAGLRRLVGSVLRQGVHGAAVNALQTDLASLGYTDNRGRVLHPDGRFGGNTEAAVRAFRNDYGLVSDGVAGLKTLEAIHARCQSRYHMPALSSALDGHAIGSIHGPSNPRSASEAERAQQNVPTKVRAALGITEHSSLHDMFEAMCKAASDEDINALCVIGKAYENSPGGQMLLVQGAELNQQQAQAQALTEQQAQAQAHQAQQRVGRSM